MSVRIIPASRRSTTELSADVSSKADKVTSATAGNLAELDASGNLVDSGITTIKPDVNPTLDLDFANEKFRIYTADGFEEFPLNGVDSKFDFTRATTKTYFDAKGVMRTAAAGEMAIDYDPATGECLGLLGEEQRTNLLIYSEQFDNAAWIKANSSVSADTATAPDGKTTADKILATSVDDWHNIDQSAAGVIGEIYSIGLFAKAAEHPRVRVAGRFSGNWDVTPTGTFDLTTGTVVSSTGVQSATMQNIGNGWYRCIVYGVPSAIGIGLSFGPVPAGGTDNNFDGTANPGGIYAWGAQLEEV